MAGQPGKIYEFTMENTGRSIINDMMMQYYDLCTLVVAESIGLQRDSIFVILDKKLERDKDSSTNILSLSESDLETIARW